MVRLLSVLLFLGWLPASHAQDIRKSPLPEWTCISGRGADGNSNAQVKVDYEIAPYAATTLAPALSDDGKVLQWVAIPKEIELRLSRVARIDQKNLYSAIYTEKIPSRSEPSTYAAAFLIETHNGYLRPFFVIFLDEDLETFDYWIEAPAKEPISMIGRTDMSGTGAFFSEYSFTFAQGIPQFEGRRDGGRGIEEPRLIK